MGSITSFFKRARGPPPTPPPTRNESEATAMSTSAALDTGSNKTKPRKGVVEEKDLGIEPTATNDTVTSLDVRASTYTMTALSQLRNAETSPFAGGLEGGVNYQTLRWWQAGMLMVAETISLGILALPAALSTLGMVAGVLLLLLLGAMASYAGLVIGQFKLAHPSIHSMADAGDILFGRVGKEVLEVGQVVFLITIMASHVVTFGIMMNVLTDHGTCTIIFLACGAILSFILNLPRKLGNMYWLSAISFLSIISAVVITMTAVALEHPAASPTGSVRLWPVSGLNFTEGFKAVANMCFAYAGHVAFFGFISELRDANDFPRALAFLQISDISMYLTTAVVIYYYTGDHVQSPALNSASHLLRKAAYGVAIPTIVIAGVVNGAVAVKYIYVRLLRSSKDDMMHQNTWKAKAIWAGLTFVGWLAAWVVAESVPVFDDLLGLSASLFASWFTFGLPGIFWVSLNVERNPKGWLWKRKGRWGWAKWVLLVFNLALVVAGAAICEIGLYSSIKNISESTNMDKPFTCKARSQGKEL